MLSTPTFERGAAQVSWREDEPGDVLYVVRGGQGRPVELNAGMLVVALLADGERNLGEIYDAVLEHGIGIDDPVIVVLTFQRLEVAGLVQMAWHFETTGAIRYECVACGQSCEGHLIGPLSDGEIERLFEFKEKLKTLEPGLPDADPIMLVSTDDQPQPVLNLSPGRCVFFGDDRLCAIHRHFGPYAKPLRCQLFPFRVIQTEAGFRVGVSARCAMAHRSFQTAEPRSPAELMTSMRLRRPPGAVVGLDHAAVRSLRRTPTFLSNLSQEGYFLSLLETDGVTLGEVIASADGMRRSKAVPPRVYLAEVARRLRRFGETYEPDPLNQPTSEFGAGVRAFLADLERLPEAPSWREPEDPARAYLLEALRQFVFLRETVPFEIVSIGVQVTLIGIAGVLWSTGSWHDGDRPSDRLGNRLAYWLRLHNNGRARHHLFDDDRDFASHMSLLSEDA